MTFPGMMLLNLAAVLLLMTGVWILSVFKHDVSIVDGVWGLGFVLVAWLTFFVTDSETGRALLLAMLVTCWGLRLSAYIIWRNWRRGEDVRYQKWRADHGERYWWVSFFTVFGLQAVILWLVSLVIQVGQWAPVPARLTWLDLLGAGIWGIGFLFESVGDWQLARFKRNPANAGKVMASGLWAYTRHPNYFGETLIWWGIFLITLSTPGSLWTLISPLLMTYLLLKVSGVSLLEKTILETRPAYREYIRRTSAFFPWPPKNPSPPQ